MKTRNLDRAIASIIKAKGKIEKMNEIYPKLYYDELNEIGKHVISMWYATYDPIYYHRQMSLRNAYLVSLEDTEYSVRFDSSLINAYSHHQDNDYIYELTFIQGYHGGDTIGQNHPNKGIPYWRTPFPQLTNWGRPAKKSWSPYYMMVSEMKKKIKEIDKKKQTEFNKVMNKVQKSINRL